MHFGIPKKVKEVKVEKYPNTAVITLHPAEKGKSRKLEFNEAAYKLLGLNLEETNEVAFHFDINDIKLNYIINANEYKSNANLKISKNKVLSNKKHYDLIKERFHSNEEDELELFISKSDIEYGDITLFNIERATINNIEVEHEEVTINEEIIS